MMLQTVLIKPEVLEASNIPVQKGVQHPGDFIINFPGQNLHLLPDICVQQCASQCY